MLPASLPALPLTSADPARDAGNPGTALETPAALLALHFGKAVEETSAANGMSPAPGPSKAGAEGPQGPGGNSQAAHHAAKLRVAVTGEPALTINAGRAEPAVAVAPSSAPSSAPPASPHETTGALSRAIAQQPTLSPTPGHPPPGRGVNGESLRAPQTPAKLGYGEPAPWIGHAPAEGSRAAALPHVAAAGAVMLAPDAAAHPAVELAHPRHTGGSAPTGLAGLRLSDQGGIARGFAGGMDEAPMLAPARRGVVIGRDGEAISSTPAFADTGPPAHGLGRVRAAQTAAEAQQTNAILRPIEQIRTAIENRGGQARIEVHLDPPELGRVQIEFEISRQGAVKAVVTASEPDTLDLLKRHAAILADELEDGGFQQIDLSWSDHQHRQRQPDGYAPLPLPAVEGPGRAPVPLPAHDGLINLSL